MTSKHTSTRRKFAIYNPYLMTLGGGERYTLNIAQSLSRWFDVEIVFGCSTPPLPTEESIRQKIIDSLGIRTDMLTFRPFVPTVIDRILAKFRFYPQWLHSYDVVLYVDNQSPMVPLQQPAIAYVQFPFDGPFKTWLSWHEWRKNFKLSQLRRYGLIFGNSFYAAHWINHYWHVEAKALQPLILVNEFFTNATKEPIIMSVGRFFHGEHNKKQLEMVEMFRHLVDRGLTWKLILVGGVDPRAHDYLELVKERSRGYPIEIYPNATFDELRALYARASIYWHATGYGEDPNKEPGKFEHFGISVVEAMASGCIPVVINAGGMQEIVESGENGYLWDTEEELQSIVERLVSSPKELESLRQRAMRRSKVFDRKSFDAHVEELFSPFIK